MSEHHDTPAGTAASPLPFTKVLSHLKSFPLISDSLQIITAHPLGQRSLSLTATLSNRFLSPFAPYLLKANELASPYVSKADDLADSGLDKVEEKFPILKEPTENVRHRVEERVGGVREKVEQGKGLVTEGRDYVFSVYHKELEKEGSKGYLPIAKAGITTTFTITADSIQWLVDQLTAKKAAAEAKVNGESEKKSGGEY